MSSDPASNRVHVSADLARNRIEIAFHGAITSAEIAQYEIEVTAAVAQLRGEFHLLTDLSPLLSMHPACIPSIERTMEIISRAGVSRIVRVIPHSSKDIGLSIMSLFHYRRGLPIITCLTREEAEQALL